MPEVKPEVHRTRIKPGFVSKYISIPEAQWYEIVDYIDANDLDEKRFLTHLLKDAADDLAKQ